MDIMASVYTPGRRNGRSYLYACRTCLLSSRNRIADVKFLDVHDRSINIGSDPSSY